MFQKTFLYLTNTPKTSISDVTGRIDAWMRFGAPPQWWEQGYGKPGCDIEYFVMSLWVSTVRKHLTLTPSLRETKTVLSKLHCVITLENVTFTSEHSITSENNTSATAFWTDPITNPLQRSGYYTYHQV